MNIRNRKWLIAPIWLLLAIDVTLTLAGQPDEYWRGDFGTAMESNPLAHPVLARGPLPFVLLAVAWALVLGISVALIPIRLAPWIAVVSTMGHAVGASTWLVHLGNWGWLLAVLYLFAASEFSWWCWQRSIWLPKKVSARSECTELE
jgi:hypothetical protein